jgi:hypothetical protein
MSAYTEDRQLVAHADQHQALALPEHLAPLSSNEWTVWRSIGLRGTGFPVDEALCLTEPTVVTAADHLLAAQAAEQQVRETIIATLRLRFDTADADEHTRCKKAIRRLQKGGIPDLDLQCADLYAPLRAARTIVESAGAAFDHAFTQGVSAISQRLYAAAGSDRVREAVTWQNRHAVQTCFDPFLREPATASRTTRRRADEELIGIYLQRYCFKNDTIGFFGPVGWASFEPDGPAASIQPGESLLAERSVYFEWWCIKALAERMERDPAMAPWMAPRRMPFVHLEGQTLYPAHRGPVRISAQQAAILRLCTGDLTAEQIATQLTQLRQHGLNHAAIYEILRTLQQFGVIAWSLDVPYEPFPEQHLRRMLARIGDEALRRQTLTMLDELEAAKDAVGQAAGASTRVYETLEGLESTFTRLTNRQATRASGQTYAGRTLVYEDCRRDGSVAFGPDFLRELGPPLTLLLTSARWLTAAAADRYRQALHQAYAEARPTTGAPTVDLVQFWGRAQPLLFGEHSPLNALVDTFQQRWADVLLLSANARNVCYSSDALVERTQQAFEAEQPGWSTARYHSPDIMVAAKDVEAICQGDYQLVMGEMHIATNTLRGSLFMLQHTHPQRLFDAIERDFPDPRIVPVLPRQWPGLTSRTLPTLISPKDVRIVMSHDSYGALSEHVLPMSAFVVEPEGDTLILRTRDQRRRFDIVEAFAESLSIAVINGFKILRADPHTPRVTIDRLVIARETWRTSADQLAFAFDKEEPRRFLEARRWALTNNIPRFVFVKVPVEVKPFFVDFDSLIYINILAKMIRRTLNDQPTNPWITITEMLPTPEQAWLVDADGQRYTSELRIVAVDMSASAAV